MKKALFVGLCAIGIFAGCGGDSASVSGGGEGATGAQEPFTDTSGVAGEIAKLSHILFKFDKYDVQSSMNERVNVAAELIKQSGAKVVLEGNTDSFGSDEYNFALGKKRADSVKKALVTRGVDSSSLSTVTYGESNPICQEQTEECYQANRRVEFKVAQ
ncbi:OmpA family protein [Helicobacter sp. 23-1048]